MRSSTLAKTAAAALTTAALGALASRDSQSLWYARLRKPGFQPPRPAGGAALAPYPLWCAFATALSTRTWQLNR